MPNSALHRPAECDPPGLRRTVGTSAGAPATTTATIYLPQARLPDGPPRLSRDSGRQDRTRAGHLLTPSANTDPNPSSLVARGWQKRVAGPVLETRRRPMVPYQLAMLFLIQVAIVAS